MPEHYCLSSYFSIRFFISNFYRIFSTRFLSCFYRSLNIQQNTLRIPNHSLFDFISQSFNLLFFLCFLRSLLTLKLIFFCLYLFSYTRLYFININFRKFIFLNLNHFFNTMLCHKINRRLFWGWCKRMQFLSLRRSWNHVLSQRPVEQRL